MGSCSALAFGVAFLHLVKCTGCSAQSFALTEAKAVIGKNGSDQSPKLFLAVRRNKQVRVRTAPGSARKAAFPAPESLRGLDESEFLCFRRVFLENGFLFSLARFHENQKRLDYHTSLLRDRVEERTDCRV